MLVNAVFAAGVSIDEHPECCASDNKCHRFDETSIISQEIMLSQVVKVCSANSPNETDIVGRRETRQKRRKEGLGK